MTGVGYLSQVQAECARVSAKMRQQLCGRETIETAFRCTFSGALLEVWLEQCERNCSSGTAEAPARVTSFYAMCIAANVSTLLIASTRRAAGLVQ